MFEYRQRRRDQLSIIASILEISQKGTLKTQIMYRANLSFTQLTEYLSFLLDVGLISKSIVRGREGYSITAKGSEFLHTHHELTKIITKSDNIKKVLITP